MADWIGTGMAGVVCLAMSYVYMFFENHVMCIFNIYVLCPLCLMKISASKHTSEHVFCQLSYCSIDTSLSHNNGMEKIYCM